MADNTHWVGTWTAAPAPAEGAAFSNHTLRMIPRVSIGGSRLRVRISNAWYVVCGGDVVAPRETSAVVALGDSLTDANISTHDGHHSWPSQLARRLVARQSGRPMAVMNQGLGGNRILHDIRGDSGLR